MDLMKIEVTTQSAALLYYYTINNYDNPDFDY